MRNKDTKINNVVNSVLSFTSLYDIGAFTIYDFNDINDIYYLAHAG
jgi:hypothetical protein